MAAIAASDRAVAPLDEAARRTGWRVVSASPESVDPLAMTTLMLDPSIDAALIESWLDPHGNIDIATISAPRELPGLILFPVDKRVGNVKHDDAALADPLEAQPSLL